VLPIQLCSGLLLLFWLSPPPSCSDLILYVMNCCRNSSDLVFVVRSPKLPFPFDASQSELDGECFCAAIRTELQPLMPLWFETMSIAVDSMDRDSFGV
jgi:hypothetical protein